MLQPAAARVTPAERAEYVRRITHLQNRAVNVTQDHLTITGFFRTHGEFRAHVAKLAERALKEAL